MNLQQKMRQPFKWRAAAKVDDVLGIDRRLVRGKPAQRQAKLRVLVTKAHVRIERADVVAQIAHRNDRVDRAMEKADRKANDVARQDHVEDLSLPAAKQLVADRVAVFDEAEIAIRVAGEDQVLSLFDQPF